MDQASPDFILEAPPDAATILQLRQQAQQNGESVVATFDGADRQPLYLVVSDRGTCVLLDEHVTIQTFNREVDAEEVADALLAEA